MEHNCQKKKLIEYIILSMTYTCTENSSKLDIFCFFFFDMSFRKNEMEKVQHIFVNCLKDFLLSYMA